MGNCAEVASSTYSIDRKQQDDYALETFRRAKVATESGLFKNEIVPVEISVKGEKKIITEDEGIKKLNAAKVPTLKPVFKPDGTVTAANASPLNDGGAALVLTTAKFAISRGLTPLARIIGLADAEKAPIEFTTAPSLAIPKAISSAGLSPKDIDLYEINEAFAVVNLANNKLLKLDPNRCNVNGGAIALGHPIGCSGARILTTLVHALRNRNGKYGVAAICNGGGGASAVVIQRL